LIFDRARVRESGVSQSNVLRDKPR
jgi:hypothetical protein